MQFSIFSITAIVLAAADLASADLHKSAVCVTADKLDIAKGSPYGTQYQFVKSHPIAADATRCACERYLARNTGAGTGDHCPDCKFDGIGCVSPDGHIGADEFAYYCQKECGAFGAEGN